jgi:hypothetical protein
MFAASYLNASVDQVVIAKWTNTCLLESSRVAAQLAASQEGLSSMSK